MKFYFFLAIIVSVLSFGAYGDEKKDSKATNTYSFNPEIMDSKNGTGSVLGINYKISHTFNYRGLDRPDDNLSKNDDGGFTRPPKIPPVVFLSVGAKGVYTLRPEENPKSQSESKVALGYSFFDSEKSLEFSVGAAIEGDQNYNNRQEVYSGKISGTYYINTANDYVSIILGYGPVDAENDEERKKITDDLKFDRANAEVAINYGLPWIYSNNVYLPDALEINYRYYHEFDAPIAVENAGIDKYDLRGIKLKFKKSLYVQYISGQLPFDKQKDEVIAVGLMHNFL